MSFTEHIAEVTRKYPAGRYGWFPWIAKYRGCCGRCGTWFDAGAPVLLKGPKNDARQLAKFAIIHESCWYWEARELERTERAAPCNNSTSA